jgi:hypothetical protein
MTDGADQGRADVIAFRSEEDAPSGSPIATTP